MVDDKHSTGASPRRGLWLYRARDEAITRLVLDGYEPKEVGHRYGVTTVNVYRIVRVTLERLTPEWVDESGRNRVWGTPLAKLRAERARFSL